MVAIHAETVGPTIEHFAGLNGDVACSRWWCRSCWCDGSVSNGSEGRCGRWGTDNIVSAVKFRVASCEVSTTMFFVA